MLRQDILAKEMDSHAAWLAKFDAHRVNKFEQLRRSNWESAASEAMIATYLRGCVDEVEPFEDLAKGGPDLKCLKHGQQFYVEITSISIKAVEKASWVPDDPHWKGGNVGSVSGIIRAAVCGKVRQCLQTDAPTLIALGLHHTWKTVSVGPRLVEDLLISDVAYQIQVSPWDPIPTQPGEFVTGLRNALFMEGGESQINPKRQPVSGVLVFGLGVPVPNVIGMLNNQPLRPFNPKLLPGIRFAETVIEHNLVAIRWLNRQQD